MVTKATRDVLNLTVREVNDFILNGTGTASIDAAPIGVTTPDAGNFTTFTASTTANFLTATVSGGVWGYPIATAAQIAAMTSADSTLIQLADGTLVQANMSTLPIAGSGSGGGFTSSATAPATTLSTPAFWWDSGDEIFYTLIDDGVTKTWVDISTSGSGGSGTSLPANASGVLTNNGSGTLTWGSASGTVGSAALGTPVSNNNLVISSDGAVLVNNSGASITPTTGLTSANLVTDGFVVVGGSGGNQYIETAAVAVPTAGYNGGDVWYDTVNEVAYILIEQAGAKVWLDFLTAGGGGGNEYIETAGVPVAASGYNGGDIWYDTTNEFAYILIEQGGVKVWLDFITAGSGSGGAATLESLWDVTAAMSVVESEAQVATNSVITEIADGTLRKATHTQMPVIPPTATLTMVIPNNSIFMSSDGVMMINTSGASITPTTGLTEANLTVDGFVSASSTGSGSSSAGTTAFESAPQAITVAGFLTIAHGLGAEPSFSSLTGWLQNTTTEHGWLVGDRVLFDDIQDAPTNRGVAIWADATNLYVQYGAHANVTTFIKRIGTIGQTQNITLANWSFVAVVKT